MREALARCIARGYSGGMKYTRGVAGNDLIFFIFFIIVLGIVWGLTGGPDRAISRAGPFLNPPFPLGSGTAYTVPGVSVPSADETKGRGGSGGGLISNITSRFRGAGGTTFSEAVSPYAGMVTLSVGGAQSGDANREYVILKTNGSVPGRLTISDWRVESTVSLTGSAIGTAASLPRVGEIQAESPVAIGPNVTVYLVTGHPPIGASFRVNACSGYLGQFQEFSPGLQKECPFPTDELNRVTPAEVPPNAACTNFVRTLDRCTFTQSGIPSGAGDACRAFVLNDLTYNGCVAAHSADVSFYRDEWHIYFDLDQALWRGSNERIRLVDENGLVIDTVTY